MEKLSETAVEALRASQNMLVEHSLDRVSSELAWYRPLPAEQREHIEAVARLGVGMFVDSVEDPQSAAKPSQIFSIVPASLTGTITLSQTLELVRTVVDVVQGEAPSTVPEKFQEAVRFSVMEFGRDIGFSAAQVYAQAAEAQGAWDARMESMAVDALLYDSPASAVARVESAGWQSSGPTVAFVARTSLDALGTARLRRECHAATQSCLVSVRGDVVIAIMGAEEHAEPDSLRRVALIQAGKIDGRAVVGPVVPEISQAGKSLRAALEGLRVLPAWPQAPNPVRADELLPERMLAGDPLAKAQLLSLVYYPLQALGENFEETVSAYLSLGGSLESTARTLFVNPNTVRYRLSRVAEQVGWDATDPRDAFMLQIALLAGRLERAEQE